MDQHSFLDDVEIGVGTWAWGDTRFWGYGRGYRDADVRGAFDAAVRAGGCLHRLLLRSTRQA